MTALTADRVQLRERDLRQTSLPVAAGVLIYAGALVAIDGDGYATPGAAATGLIGVGVAAARADNSLGDDGAINVEIRRGVYRFHNSTGDDLISAANVGATCYMIDDQTVALTDGNGARSVAGMVLAVDAGGVWIQFLSVGALTADGISTALGGTPVLADGSVPFTGDVIASGAYLGDGSQLKYTTSLEMPAGATAAWVNAINNSGVMAGMAVVGDANHPFEWAADGTATDLGLPTGATAASARDLNDAGVKAGVATIGGVYHPFKWAADGTATDLGLPTGATVAWVDAINASGVMVGGATIGGANHPFKWAADGTPADLGLPAGATAASLTAINASGVMVGTATIGGVSHPLKWAADGTPTDLMPAGATSGHAAAINASGVMVGYATIGGVYHPFKWATDGTPTDLGLPAGATVAWVDAINSSGVMVGGASIGVVDHIVKWAADGTATDLGGFGFTYAYAYALNDAGVIAGEMYNVDGPADLPLLIPTNLSGLPIASAAQNGLTSQVDYAKTVRKNADGSTTLSGGLVLPTADPHIAGVWWDNAGVLTKSAG